MTERYFALPDNGARNEQVRDVGAHDRDGQQRHDREIAGIRFPCIATMLLPPAVAEYGTSRNLIRCRTGNARCICDHSVDSSVSPPPGRGRRQPADHRDVDSGSTRLEPGTNPIRHRDPEIGELGEPGAAKSGLRNANNRRRLPVQSNGAAGDVVRRLEVVLPEMMRRYGNEERRTRWLPQR